MLVEIADRTLNINLNDSRAKVRYRIFTLLFRLGQYTAISNHLAQNGCEGEDAGKMVNWTNPPSERTGEGSHNLLWHCMWGFYKVFSEVEKRSIRLLFSRYSQLLHTERVDALLSLHDV